ncbi:MAG: hypothetical protein K1X75_16900, partial [Leptospirales bacterium]|nr:hypothetical protein [Leptospirales bacterium]
LGPRPLASLARTGAILEYGRAPAATAFWHIAALRQRRVARTLYAIGCGDFVMLTFVLGAGFSHSFNPDLPLTKDLLRIAETRGLFQSDSYKEHLQSYIHEYFNGTFDDVNFEVVATFLVNTPLPIEGEDVGQFRTLFGSLISILKSVLADRNVFSKATGQNRDRLRKCINHLIFNNAYVITFNYDLIVDNELHSTDHWFPATGYGPTLDFPPHFIPNSSLQPLLTKFYKKSNVQVLKLHGSFNWGTPHLPYPGIPQNVFLDFPYDPGGNKRPLDPIEVTRYLDAKSSSRFHYSTYIVPPIYGKRFEDPLITDIWYRATQRLTASKSTYIIGYSFPESDITAERMFRESQRKPLSFGAARQVTIVDPSIPDSRKERIRSIFFNSNVQFEEMDAFAFLEKLTAANGV